MDVRMADGSEGSWEDALERRVLVLNPYTVHVCSECGGIAWAEVRQGHIVDGVDHAEGCTLRQLLVFEERWAYSCPACYSSPHDYDGWEINHCLGCSLWEVQPPAAWIGAQFERYGHHEA